MGAISSYLKDRVVLVTGGGGSIGSELCRQIARFEPKRLVIFDIYENNAYELANELNAKYGKSIPLTVLIGSVRDLNRLEQVFEEIRPEVVFHAAAHKHVPLMEFEPRRGSKEQRVRHLQRGPLRGQVRCKAAWSRCPRTRRSTPRT